MATNRKWTGKYCTLLNDTSCGLCNACENMKVQGYLYTFVDNDYLTREHKTCLDIFIYNVFCWIT